MEKKIKGWRLVVFCFEAAFMAVVIIALMVAISFAMCLLSLVTLDVWSDLQLNKWPMTIFFTLAASFYIYAMYRGLKSLWKLGDNFIFLLRNPHNAPCFLYEGLDRC